MAFYAMSKDFAIFKSGIAPFFMKTSKNCQGKMNKKIRSYDFGRVVPCSEKEPTNKFFWQRQSASKKKKKKRN